MASPPISEGLGKSPYYATYALGVSHDYHSNSEIWLTSRLELYQLDHVLTASSYSSNPHY